MPLSPGTRLGSYSILSAIGAGGMGEVYRARDTRLERDVAMKVLPDALAHDPERLARFEREAKVLAALNHPHIAHIHGLEESGGLRALVMELVEGEDLAQWIGRGAMPLHEVLQIARQIAEALEAAHEQGIIHRDLKPANIKVRADGTVKVLDFGLAKAIEPASVGASAMTSPTLSMHATQAGIILGTAAYMSPEQAAGKPVDKRSDLWSFGVVILEMLTGQPVFTGETVSHVLASVLKSDPDWTTLPASTPAPLRRLLRRCLEKDRKRRLDSALAARLEIDEALAAPSPVDDPTQPTSDSRPSTGSRALPWLIIAALSSALLMLWVRWPTEKPVDRPLVRLDVDLGADVSLPAPSALGSSIAISADGMRLAYGSGTPARLFTRRLDQPNATELPGTQGATRASFSPDGQWVGFVSGGKASKVSVEGGAVVPLSDMTGVVRVSWSQDGSIVLWASQQKLLRIPSGGGPPENVAALRNGELGMFSADALPGGKALLIGTDNPGPVDKTTIDVVTLADHQRKTVLVGGASPRYVATSNKVGHLLYVNGVTLFAVPFDPNTLSTRGTAVPIVNDVAHEGQVGVGQYDVSQTGTLVYRRAIGASGSGPTALEWIDASGKRQRLPIKPRDYQDLSLSPDGKRIALSISDGTSQDVWVYDTQRDAMTRLTFGGATYRYPVWTPDGKSILLSSVGNGIIQTRADGASQPRTLIQSNLVQIPSSFTPDGKRLAYFEVAAGTRQLWTLPLHDEGGHLKAGSPERFLSSSSIDVSPSFSPDGQWLAYQSNESGTAEVYVRSFPPPASGPGGRWLISNSGGTNPRWSRAGHDLLYQAGSQIMTVRYTINGDAFVAEKPRVWIDRLGASPIVGNFSSWDVTSDAKRVAILTPAESAEAAKQEHEVVFLMNFFDELRRRSAAGK